jgi:TonB family protein
MSGPAAVAQASIAGFALHALWQVPLIGAAAWIAVRMGRPRVRVAHALWSVTLVLCVLTPCVSTMAGRRAALAAERAARESSVTYSLLDYAGPLPAFQREPLLLRLFHRHVNASGLHPFSFTLSNGVERGVAIFYVLVSIYFLLRLAVAWRRSARLVRNSTAEALPYALAVALLRRCEQLRIERPAIRISSQISGPALAGVRRPTLLLPGRMALQMSATEIDAVLAHELSHLRRRDPVMHAVSSLLLIPIGFHPAALWVARRVRQTREMACDAEAAEQMGSPARYARALLQVAERTGGRPARVAGSGFFTTGLGFLGTSLELFGAGGAMEERMETLMQGKHAIGGRLQMGVGLGIAAAAIVAATMVQVQPALAAEQSAKDAAQCQGTAQQTKLIGGDHAREQLRNATRRLDQAQQNATTDLERQKIATARDLAAAAEQQIAAVSGHAPRSITMRGQDSLDAQRHDRNATGGGLAMQISPDAQVRLLQMQMDQQSRLMNERLKAQLDSPEWKEQFAEAEKLRAQFDSPEWKAQIAKQREEAEKIRARMNSPEWRAEMQAHVADAQQARDRVMKELSSAKVQRLWADNAQIIARLEMPPVPPMPAMAAVDPQTGKVLKVASGVMAGNLIHHENPTYPPEAKEKKIQGAVVLHAVISEAGTVENLQVVSSPDSLLSQASLDAVKQWIYKPYLLNGDPTAVETTITVNFSLAP